EVLTQSAKDLVEKIKTIPGAVDVDTTVKPGLPAFAVRLKDSAIRELGLTAPQIAASLRAYVNGDVATYWTTPDGNQVEVMLRLPREQ
ncbi:efflux RND transporter permease subunit, partial [Klebsiella pneumoniae]